MSSFWLVFSKSRTHSLEPYCLEFIAHLGHLFDPKGYEMDGCVTAPNLMHRSRLYSTTLLGSSTIANPSEYSEDLQDLTCSWSFDMMIGTSHFEKDPRTHVLLHRTGVEKGLTWTSIISCSGRRWAASSAPHTYPPPPGYPIAL